MVQNSLTCAVRDFSCTYLGLPLLVRKLTEAQLQPLLDRLADKLPGWKAVLLHLASRLILVCTILTFIPIYQLFAIDIPKWAIRAIDKLRHAFLWKGKANINGGHCVIAWSKVCHLLELGGLGIHNLKKNDDMALRMRWLWLQKTQPDKPWASFGLQVHHNARALFSISIISNVGNDQHTLFWVDR